MWARSDIAWLSGHYSTLKLISDGVVGGRLTFQMLRTNGKYFVNPSPDQITDTSSEDFLYLSDTYDIEIRLVGEHSQPMAYEVGGKIDRVAQRFGKSQLDMHKYTEGGLCVASSMQIEKAHEHGFDISHFINEFLIPYLFAQTHYANTKEWLWGELEHGYLGLLQWLGRLDDWYDKDVELTYKWMNYHNKAAAMKIIGMRWRGHKKCICKSSKKMRDCHSEIKKALSMIRTAINNGTLDISKYYDEKST